jgi:glutamate racemase
MKITSPIVVFDSGIGGLSIYKPLRIALPQENIVYIADSANFPYGDKTPAWLSARFIELSAQFADLDPKLVVLACNSATTNIIEEVRSRLKRPVVGVEPVIKPLAQFESALALMTTVSSSSPATAKLLSTYGKHVQVYTPKGLASAIEFNNYDQVKKSLHEIKKIVQRNHVQAIGLSCTHYPLIINEFKKSLPGVEFIDPSEAVVKQVLRVLKSG